MSKIKVFNSETKQTREMGEIQFEKWGKINGWVKVPEVEKPKKQETPKEKDIWVRDSMDHSDIRKNESGQTENGGTWEMLYRDEVENMGIDPETTQNSNHLRPKPQEPSNEGTDTSGKSNEDDAPEEKADESGEENETTTNELGSKDFGVGEAVAMIKEMAEKEEFDKVKRFSNGDERSTIEKAVKKFVPNQND